jgi:rhamnosyltransferase
VAQLGMAHHTLESSTRTPRVAALVVTHFPDPDCRERVARIHEQVRRLVIVDNGSDTTTFWWADELADTEGVTVERNGTNLGIAAALNRGITLLAAEGYDWVITFDQDSTIESGFVAALLETVAHDPAPDSIALVGANRHDDSSGAFPQRWVRPRRIFPFFERVAADRIGPDGVTLVITSGTLTSVKAFNLLGPFRTDFFIDLVDSEYCLRARQANSRILVSPRARMRHRVGAKQRVALVGVGMSPMHHSPVRKYYIFRNAVTVIRRYGGRFPHWLVYQLLALAEILVGILFFERDKSAKLKACWRGIRDGLAGRMGPARHEF